MKVIIFCFILFFEMQVKANDYALNFSYGIKDYNPIFWRNNDQLPSELAYFQPLSAFDLGFTFEHNISENVGIRWLPCLSYSWIKERDLVDGGLISSFDSYLPIYLTSFRKKYLPSFGPFFGLNIFSNKNTKDGKESIQDIKPFQFGMGFEMILLSEGNHLLQFGGKGGFTKAFSKNNLPFNNATNQSDKPFHIVTYTIRYYYSLSGKYESNNVIKLWKERRKDKKKRQNKTLEL